MPFSQFTKFLCVYVDDKLRFDKHVDCSSDMISKSIGVMYRIRSLVPCRVMISLYYSLIYPYLIYCNQAWGFT